MSDISSIKLPDSNTYTLKDQTQNRSDHRHYDGDLIPLVHKVYESTSYYATANDWANASWYFMSIKPDTFYKPWRVKIKVHTYCPSYAGYHSYTWSTICGRYDGLIYANWNEKYNTAHSYFTFYPLKQAGFDAGYGHAVGISIYNADNQSKSAYYRTFEIDYYECENCTVTILDTPVKWANWNGTGSTNYGSLASMDAITRGLCETNDANTVTENRINYFAGKTGARGVWANSLFMEDVNGTFQNICMATDNTSTSLGTRTTATTKIPNTNGFKVNSTIYYTITTYAGSTNINGSSVVYSSISVFDTRYSFNTTLTANFLTPYKPLYLVGTIHNDGLYYLDSTWWTQTPNDTSKIYVLVGGVYDSTTSYCRATLYEQNKWYRYDGTNLIEISNDSITVNGHTVEKDVPSNADFTNTTYTLDRNGENVRLTPSSGSAQNVSLSDLINGLSTGASELTANDYVITQYVGGGTTTMSYHRRPANKVINKTLVDSALGKGSDTSKFYCNDGTWRTVEEEKLQWGGPSKVGTLSPVGMSLSSEHSANRLAFINKNALRFEYSSDAGATWTEYTDYDIGTDSANWKTEFCTKSYNVPVGRQSSATEITTDSRTRFTITAQNGTSGYVYTNPKKVLLYVSTATYIIVDVETRSGTNMLNDGAWSLFGTYNLQGWSGWNDLPIILGTLGGATNQPNNVWQLRFTFRPSSVSSSYPKTCSVLGIRLFGENAWTVYNDMARNNHLYAYDYLKNAIFPANLKLNGDKQVGYLTATPTSGQVVVTDGTSGGMKTTGYTIAKSVPSDAVFTDHTYSGTGLISVNGSGVISTTAQANVIETVKVNGTALTPSSKAVDISVPTITDTYSSTSTNGMSGKAVASALGTLDVTGASSISASKTISAWSETDGKVSITTQDISITKSQVSDFPTLGTASAKDVPSSGNASSTQVVMGNDTRLTNSRTPTSHTHGKINNDGQITTTTQSSDVTIANNDKLLVADNSDSNRVVRTSVTFDGSTTTQCLTKKGTWANFTNNAGTITGITMNGSSKGTSGVVDLGTVITDKSDKMDKQNPTGSGRFLMNDPTVTGDCYGSNALGGSSGRNTLYYTNYSTIVCGMDNQIGNTSSDVSNNCLMAGSNNTIYNGADNGTVLGNANRIDNASNSFVTGLGNTNIWNNCSVSGRYNNTTAFPISTISNDLSTYSVLECIGNGSGTTTDQPQYWNARVLLGNGNEYVAGDIRSGGNISADNGRVLAGLDVNATTDVTAGKNMKANGRYITPYSTTATTNCINPTQSGGSAAATIGNLQFSVVGNLAILNCTIAWNESIHSSAITLGQLYTAFKPIAQVGCIALTDNGNGGSFGYGRLIIDTNGYIKIYPVTNSAYSSCHRVYVNVNYVLNTAYTVS